jgi:hypothetical protein
MAARRNKQDLGEQLDLFAARSPTHEGSDPIRPNGRETLAGALPEDGARTGAERDSAPDAPGGRGEDEGRNGDDVRTECFAGFDLFLRPSLNNTVEIVVRGKNSYAARVTDTAQVTIRSLEATVQGFEERAANLETDIADAHKRGKELESKVGAPFEHEERYQHLSRRQSEIEEKLDLTRNQAPSQVDVVCEIDDEAKNSEIESVAKAGRHKRRAGVRV